MTLAAVPDRRGKRARRLAEPLTIRRTGDKPVPHRSRWCQKAVEVAPGGANGSRSQLFLVTEAVPPTLVGAEGV